MIGCYTIMLGLIWVLCSTGFCSLAAGYSMIIFLSVLTYLCIGWQVRLNKRIIVVTSLCLFVFMVSSWIDAITETSLETKIIASKIMNLMLTTSSMIFFCITLILYEQGDRVQPIPEYKPITRDYKRMRYAAAATTA